jgi:hypothetical protein
VIGHLDAAHVLGEVHARLDLGRHVGDALGQRLDPARQLAGQLCHRQRVRAGGLGVDQIGHRLGLGEIDPPVEERPQRELAGPREPCPRRQQGGEHAPRRQLAAVTRKLDHILARVRARRAEHRRHDFVDARRRRAARPHRPAVMECVTGRLRERCSASKHCIGDGERPGAAHAHDRESGGAGRGGDGGDRVVQRWDHGCLMP